MPKVSVVVLNFNGKKHLRKCLNSLKKQTFKDFEVIVSDNNSRDGSQEMVRKEFPGFRLLANDRNYGVSEGYNRGVATAKGRYVVTMANDMQFDREWIKEAVKPFKEKDVAVVTTYIKNRDKGYYKGEEVFGFSMDLVGNPVTFHKPAGKYVFGGNGIVFDREKIPVPYDNTYFYAGDEIYLAWQVWLRGYKAVQQNTAKLLHFGRVSVDASNVNVLVEFHAEKDKYLNLFIYYGTATLLKVMPLIITNIALTTIAAILRGRLLVRARSYMWLLRNIGFILRKRREIQRLRRRSEREMLQLMTCRNPYNNKLIEIFFRIYCMAFRMPVMELAKKK